MTAIDFVVLGDSERFSIETGAVSAELLLRILEVLRDSLIVFYK